MYKGFILVIVLEYNSVEHSWDFVGTKIETTFLLLDLAISTYQNISKQ